MNSDESGREPGHQSRHVLTRRTALRGAAVAVSLTWVAPTLQVVSMDAAAGASAPPATVRGTRQHPIRAAAGTDQGELPVTGAQGTWEALGVGAATVAAGAAAIVAAHHLKTRAAGTGPGAEASEALGEESS
jgi:hypothetical protein